ncbi:MAG: hypothetical protein ACR5KX_02290 [Wolbachia sp.]
MASELNKSTKMGEEEGREAGKIKVAKNLLKAGISVDIISKQQAYLQMNLRSMVK